MKLVRLRPKYWGTYIVMALVAGIMVLLVVPGEGWTVRQVNTATQQVLATPEWDYRHGWPWTYQRCKQGEFNGIDDFYGRWQVSPVMASSGSSPVQFEWDYNYSFPWLYRDAWRFDGQYQEFHWTRLLADIAIALIAVLIAGCLYEAWRSRRHRVWQFYLLDGAVALTLICVACAYVAYHLRIQQLEVAGDASDDPATTNRDEDYVGPDWAKKLIGPANLLWFIHTTHVEIWSSSTTASLTAQQVRNLSHHYPMLISLRLNGIELDEPTIQSFGELSNLRKLCLMNCDGVNRFPYIDLDLRGDSKPAETPEDIEPTPKKLHLAPLQHVPRLEALSLFGEDLLEGIAPLPVLKRLELREQLTPAEIERLVDPRQFPQLQDLTIEMRRSVDPEFLLKLGGLKSLELLGSFDDRWIAAVSRLDQLETLSISNNGGHLKGNLTPLSKLPRIRYFSIDDSPPKTEVRELRNAWPNAAIKCYTADE